MLVLGVESSCDETAVALYHSHQGLIADKVYSQIGLHAEYGGVVPELASRDHIRKLLALIDALLKDSDHLKSDLSAIAFTNGPGLAGALMVGAVLSRSLAYALSIPAIEVHHMEAHLLAPMLEEQVPTLPFIALLVSGGHTQLIQVNQIGDYQLLGDTLDDAAGEAFDKAAKMMGLPYPGGPIIAKLAQQYRTTQSLNPSLVDTPIKFPRPMTNKPGLDFSFSGLKTFTLNCLQQHILPDGTFPDEQTLQKIACAFEEAVVQTLAIKCSRALNMTGISSLVLAGGVAANQHLREYMPNYLKRHNQTNIHLYYPQAKYCTDNGAMIAYAGYIRLLKQQTAPLGVCIRPRWSLEELTHP